MPAPASRWQAHLATLTPHWTCCRCKEPCATKDTGLAGPLSTCCNAAAYRTDDAWWINHEDVM